MKASERRKKMRKNLRNKSKEWNKLTAGIALTAAFVVWTLLIKNIDVKAVGPGKSCVGFAAVNVWFHNLTGVNWDLYTITDWLVSVPFAYCQSFIPFMPNQDLTIIVLANTVCKKDNFKIISRAVSSG